jgi:hypothetical protein
MTVSGRIEQLLAANSGTHMPLVYMTEFARFGVSATAWHHEATCDH